MYLTEGLLFTSYLIHLLLSCQAYTTRTESPPTTTTKFNDLIFYDPEILCKLQPVAFDCDESGYRTPHYYYDIKLEDCKSGSFGHKCPYNVNKFKSITECHNSCRVSGSDPIDYKIPHIVFCRLQPDFGQCNSYQPMWYFDVTTKRCRGFSYSGCGGNQNRFATSRECVKICRQIFH